MHALSRNGIDNLVELKLQEFFLVAHNQNTSIPNKLERKTRLVQTSGHRQIIQPRADVVQKWWWKRENGTGDEDLNSSKYNSKDGNMLV